MLKDVGMAVPKTRESRVVYMPQDKRLWHTTIIPCVTSPYISLNKGATHGIIVVCRNLLSCGIYTALVFGTAIPTSFSILMKIFILYTSTIHIPSLFKKFGFKVRIHFSPKHVIFLIDKETNKQLKGLHGVVVQLQSSVDQLQGSVEQLQEDSHLCCNPMTGSFHNPAHNCSHIVYNDPNATSGTCVYTYVHDHMTSSV